MATRPWTLRLWPALLAAVAVQGYPQVELTPVPVRPGDPDYPGDLVDQNRPGPTAGVPNGAPAGGVCNSIGLDYQNDGTYFIDSTLDEFFFFRSEFSGCGNATAYPYLVDPEGAEYACDSISTYPDMTEQVAEWYASCLPTFIDGKANWS
jgi:hypothetical protein